MDRNAGPRTTSSDPDEIHGALLVVAAAAGLVWALAHGPSGDAGGEAALKPPPDTPKPSR